MYTPKHYEVTDRSKMLEFMKGNSFGILFSHTGNEPSSGHIRHINWTETTSAR